MYSYPSQSLMFECFNSRSIIIFHGYLSCVSSACISRDISQLYMHFVYLEVLRVLGARCKNRVDHMNHTILGLQIGLDNLSIIDEDTSFVDGNGQIVAQKGDELLPVF